MASVAAMGAAAEEKKKALTGPVLMAVCAAAMEMCSEPVTEKEPWQPLFDSSAKLDQLFDRPFKYQKLCRLTPDETIKLLKIMGFANPRHIKGRFKYNDLHRFMIFLQSIAQYRSFETLSEDVGWSVDSLETNVNFWTAKLIETLNDNPQIGVNGWTNAEQRDWIEHPQKPEFPECIGAVDGMYLQINRPQVQPQLYYSQYKKYHALLFIIVCDRAGRIRYLTSALKPGHTSETSSFSANLPFNLIAPLKLLGDGAYTGDDRVLYPFAKDELGATGTLTRYSKLHWNYRLRRQRVLVEWVSDVCA